MQRLSSILFFFFISLFLMTGTAMGQRNAAKADRYFDKNLFEEAIKYYNLEIKAGRDRDVVNYSRKQIAECYRIIGEFEQAEETYARLLKKKNNQEDPEYYLNYARSLKSSAKYAEAKEQFEKYIELNPDDPMGPILLQSCDSAQKWLDETLGETVNNLTSINSPAADFAPVFSGPNSLLFSSSRDGSTEALISFNGGLQVNHLDFYDVNIGYLNQDSMVLNKAATKGLNSPFHEGPATFSADGLEVYFTRTVEGEKNSRTNDILNTLQVFYSKKDSVTNTWSEPISAFSFNSVNYSIGQPSLSYDGETIFYASDKRKGYGGTDIYYSEKNPDGSWGEPINCGENVNTFGYELFPYVAKDGTLYFSSDSHTGMGQLDIFSSTLIKVSRREDAVYADVRNLKPPINSIGNDFGIAFDPSGNRGFFSSDRFNGVGAEDIYSFGEPVDLRLQLNGDELVFADARVFDGIKYKWVEDAPQITQDLASSNGTYSVSLKNKERYTLIAKSGFFPYNSIHVKLAYEAGGADINLEINTSNKPVFIAGTLLQKTPGDTLNPNGRALPFTKVKLFIGDSLLETITTDSNGFYAFSTPLDPNNIYYIRSTVKH